MAAQTDAPDDLIAELARLMADDVRSDGPQAADPSKNPAAPVRIPGTSAAPAPTVSAPRVEPTVPTSRQEPTLAPAQPRSLSQPMPPTPGIRIPGSEPATSVPASAAPSAPGANFDFTPARRSAAPVATTPIVTAPVPAATQPVVSPVTVAPEPASEPQALDHDSLSDLIAAELANEDKPAPDPKPQPQAAPATKAPAREEDSFNVPPVFGFGSPSQPPKPQSQSAAAVTIVEPELSAPRAPKATPVKPAPSVATDSLSDIERLVGPAVRMPAPPAPAASPAPAPAAAATPTPSPALRSLATPTLPTPGVDVPAVRKPRSAEAGSVDDAILAAAAATGARVEWVNPEADFSDQPTAEPAARSRRRGPVFGLSRAIAGPLVAVALLLVAGIGLYFMLGQSTAPTGPAPLIVADTAPVKEVPEPVETEASQSVVFNEMSGGNDGTNEQLVSRDQADEEAVTEATTTAAATPEPATNVIASGDSASVNPNQDGLVNRRVRTVTVRPDGTIVSGEDSLAGASILPVDRPNVPDVPGADFSAPDLLANTGTADPTSAAATPTDTATAVPEPATPTVTPVEPGSIVPVVDATGTAITGRSVVTPVQRPTNFAQSASAALSAAAAAPTAAPTGTEVAAAAPSPGTAAAYVQLSSQRSEEAARESAQAIATRYGVLFGGANLEIQRVDLPDRGTFYRVLVSAPDRGNASNICTNVKAAGGDCFVL